MAPLLPPQSPMEVAACEMARILGVRVPLALMPSGGPAYDTSVMALVAKIAHATGRSQEELVALDSEAFLALAEDVTEHGTAPAGPDYLGPDFRKRVVGGTGPFLFPRSHKKCFTFQLGDYPPLTVNLAGLLDQHRPQTILSAVVVADALSCAWDAHNPSGKGPYGACSVDKAGRLVLSGRYSVKVLQSQNNDCAELLGFRHVLSPACPTAEIIDDTYGMPLLVRRNGVISQEARPKPAPETEKEGAARLLRNLGHCTTCGALTGRERAVSSGQRVDGKPDLDNFDLCEDCTFAMASAEEAAALSKELRRFHHVEKCRTHWPWLPIFGMYVLAIVGGA